jgi:hypothetical protein
VRAISYDRAASRARSSSRPGEDFSPPAASRARHRLESGRAPRGCRLCRVLRLTARPPEPEAERREQHELDQIDEHGRPS